MTIQEKLKKLRSEMERHGIDVYIVPDYDFHGSEYIGSYFKTREFITGFTGSAGTAVITFQEALLWTDGRYFIQARQQLEGTEFVLMKSGEKNVPSIAEYIERLEGAVIGFDGRMMPEYEAVRYGYTNPVICDVDLIGDIWEDRPEISHEKVWRFPEKYAGESCAEKISKIRGQMQEENADVLLMTGLDEIAWTLNLRGNDIKYTPVFLAFMIITQQKIHLFADRSIFSKEILNELNRNHICLEDYDSIYAAVTEIKQSRIWLDGTTANHKIMNSVQPDNVILDKFTPAFVYKAEKNQTEIENIKKAHLYDGVAMTKFLYWLKTNVGKIPLTELVLEKKLEEFRCRVKSYIEPSFAPIVAYQEHGAIVHYSATKETDCNIEAKGMVLIDSGAHYMEGTTDVTRTISLGAVTEEMREMYTAVLKGHLKLSDAVFPEGCTGVTLDYIAREALWKKGYNYNHGTGHGVGHVLNVHEGPNAFRYRIMENPGFNPPIRPGMVTSNEPGVYLEGKFGIRIENLILCKKMQKTDCGQFLGLEDLTLIPYDMELIDETALSPEETELLYHYHRMVFSKLAPYLEEDEKIWLKKYIKFS